MGKRLHSTPHRSVRASFLSIVFLAIMFGTAGSLVASSDESCQDDSKTFEPSTRTGRFGASFDESRNVLSITLKVYFEFVRGEESEAPGFAAADYEWQQPEDAPCPNDCVDKDCDIASNPAQDKSCFIEQFKNQVRAAWSGKYVFDPDEIALDVKVERVCQARRAHWVILAERYPDMSPDTSASVCPPGMFHLYGGCEYRPHSHEDRRGTVRLASTHIRPAFVLPLSIGPHDFWFDRSSSVVPEREFDPVRPITKLLGSTTSRWSAQLTAYAIVGESDSWSRGQTHPAVDLAKRRAEALRDRLVEVACTGRPSGCEEETTKRVRIFVDGRPDSSPYDDPNFVRLEVFQGGEERTIQTFAHEAGHMFGLGDEAADDLPTLGAPLLDQNYAALISFLLDKTVVRHDDEGIMSRGGVVRDWHYVTFLEALMTLKRGDYRIVPPPGGARAASPESFLIGPENQSTQSLPPVPSPLGSCVAPKWPPIDPGS